MPGTDYSHSVGSGGSTKVLIRPHMYFHKSPQPCPLYFSVTHIEYLNDICMALEQFMSSQFCMFTIFIHALMDKSVRNWCVHWAFAIPRQELYNACTESTYEIRPFKTWVSNALSIRIRNWCICWAFTLGTDAYTLSIHISFIRLYA